MYNTKVKNKKHIKILLCKIKKVPESLCIVSIYFYSPYNMYTFKRTKESQMRKLLILILSIILAISLVFIGISCAGKTSTEEEVVEEEEEAEEEEDGAAVESEEETVEEEGKLAKEGEVTFMTEDNIELNGNIFGSGDKWVILSHMYPTDQTSWFEFAEMLKENGYIVFTYDFRGYGKSGGSQDISKIDIDLTAALEYIKQYDPELIYLMGASMGGTASLFVASKERIDGVISFSSPSEVQSISAISVIGDIVPAKLFIAASGDGDAAQQATDMYEKSMEPKFLEILDGNSHGTFMFEEEPENAEKVEEIVLNFLY
jgi:alpha/beta superfamily hydrolase